MVGGDGKIDCSGVIGCFGGEGIIGRIGWFNVDDW